MPHQRMPENEGEEPMCLNAVGDQLHHRQAVEKLSAATARDTAFKPLQQPSRSRSSVVQPEQTRSVSSLRQQLSPYLIFRNNRPPAAAAPAAFWIGRNTLDCGHCGQTCSTRHSLTRHERTHTRPYMCGTCGKTFARTFALRNHVHTHTGEKPFKCRHCDRTFADPSNRRNHQFNRCKRKK